jgi:hypothetical protein
LKDNDSCATEFHGITVNPVASDLATYYKLRKVNFISCIVVQAEQLRSLPIVHFVILSTNTNGEASEYYAALVSARMFRRFNSSAEK